jgi:phosphohistidine phosphatase
MERQLIVLRHAKSDWHTDAPTDHERPLNQRGRTDAPTVAQRICELGWTPDYVVSSDSLRTRETFELMSPAFTQALGREPVVQFLGSLYHAGPSDVEYVLSEVPDEVSPVMAIGHNPGWEAVIDWLTGESIRMTTANAALLSIDANSWPAAMGRAGSWNLVNVIRPKDLAG